MRNMVKGNHVDIRDHKDTLVTKLHLTVHTLLELQNKRKAGIQLVYRKSWKVCTPNINLEGSCEEGWE